ncbi:MAG: hypothetical protein ACXWID_08370 [Pyrinomonadaceae bacterium]
MKTRSYMIIALFVLIGTVTLSVSAQTTSRVELRVDIPFDFNVGNETLAAGRYRLLSVSNDSANVIFKFESADRSGFMLRMAALEGKGKDSARLVFHRYGNRYFFSEAWLNAANGWQAPKSREERASEREMAALAVRFESVAVRTR